MSKPVTKADVQNAAYTIEHLAPAVAAVEKIHPQVFRYNKQAMAETTAFLEFLRGNLEQAQAVIQQAEHQHEGRDQDLIVAALTRISSIDSEIKVAQAKAKALRVVFENKVLELRKQQFTDNEISKIIPDPGVEIAELTATCENLAKENLNIQKFLDSAPEYNPAFLDSTQVSEVLELRNAFGIKATRT